MKIMAVMAHPDDAEIWCGGTLILHAEKGDPVQICILSYEGDSGRGEEARLSANRMGCEVEFYGFRDAEIRETKDALKRLIRSLEQFKPDVVITHWFDDLHPDHEAVFLLLRRALFTLYFRDKRQLSPRLFCCDTYDSQGIRGLFQPDRFVDVSGVWDKKTAAIRAHGTQPLSFFLDMIGRQCIAHGKSVGVARAEGFIYVPVVPDQGEPLGGGFQKGRVIGP